MARMPREAAAQRLSALIEALPREPASAIRSKTNVADLVALLPTSNAPITRRSDQAFAPTDLREPRLLLAPCAFAGMMLVIFAISALLSPGPETGANPSTTPAAAAGSPLRREPGP